MSPIYRLYILDARDRSIIEVVELGECGSDEAAKCRSLVYVDCRPAELWDRARMVKAFNNVAG